MGKGEGQTRQKGKHFAWLDYLSLREVVTALCTALVYNPLLSQVPSSRRDHEHMKTCIDMTKTPGISSPCPPQIDTFPFPISYPLKGGAEPERGNNDKQGILQ